VYCNAAATLETCMGEEVPIAVAARRLGVSPDTIKRRIRRGDLEARRVGRPQGYRWLVTVPDNAAPVDTGSLPGSASVDAVALAVAQAEVRRLEETVQFLSRELDNRQREVSQLHVLLGQARAQLSTSDAPVHTGAFTDVAPLHAPAPQQRPQPPRQAPLWKRIMWALRGR
jgi:DNA-directed RNA polymerase specialized sigma24 family protein